MCYIGRFTLTLAAASLLAGRAGPLAAQTRLWAAQTGPDQVTLAWDSIPGALEYRIYIVSSGKMDEQRQALRLSGSSRRADLFGIQRLAHGVYLLAAGANDRVLQRVPFNAVTPATTVSPITAPAEVTAEAPSAAQVELSWNGVPGATAYSIVRAVGGSGFRPLCDLCSTDPHYVDQSVSPGFPHTYAVTAIFPQGTSRRTASNQVTPGMTQATPSGSPPVTPPATSSTPAPSTPAGTPATSAGAPPAGTTHAATPVSPTGATSVSTQNPPGGVVGAVGGILGNLVGGVAPATDVSALATGPGAVRLVWVPSTTAGITEYRIGRRVNGGAVEPAGNVGPATRSYTDTFFPVTLFATGPVHVTYVVYAYRSSTYGPAGASNEVVVQAPAAPAAAPAGSGCKLDYQRADNMWAAAGRPDGPLGTETLSLGPGQDKVFVTDWKYEKQRNDGTNFYGSHLRIATNPGAHSLRLQLRSGTTSSWIRLDPGKSEQFRADLLEVYCEN